MHDSDALNRIQELLDGVAWTPDVLDEIAAVLIATGRRVRDLNDRDREDLEPCTTQAKRVVVVNPAFDGWEPPA